MDIKISEKACKGRHHLVYLVAVEEDTLSDNDHVLWRTCLTPERHCEYQMSVTRDNLQRMECN